MYGSEWAVLPLSGILLTHICVVTLWQCRADLRDGRFDTPCKDVACLEALILTCPSLSRWCTVEGRQLKLDAENLGQIMIGTLIQIRKVEEAKVCDVSGNACVMES